MKELFRLFAVFAKIGAITFGGGYAMLPILQREIVDTRGWATEEELADYFAIGQCTPGIIAVNTATFVGQKQRGVSGALAATLGVVFPSIVIINLIAGVLTHFAEYPVVQNALAGVRVCVCVLIFNAVCKLWGKAVKTRAALCVFLAVAICALFLPLSPAIYVAAAAALGVSIEYARAKGGKKA